MPDMQRLIGEFGQQMDARFHALNARFEAIHRRFDRLETEYRSHEVRLDE